MAEFCAQVDARIREALVHQRFPVEGAGACGEHAGSGEVADRPVIDFLPSAFTVPFGGATASASLMSGLGRGSGLMFTGAGDELLLSTFGTDPVSASVRVTEMAGHLERVLAAMTADPARRLSSVDPLAGAQRAQVSTRWATGRCSLHAAREQTSIPAMFGAHAKNTPAAVAVSGADTVFTYAALDEAANRLAHRLIDEGARPRADRRRCCCRGRPKPSPRSWRSSRPVRRTCPSTRSLPAARIAFMLGRRGPRRSP